MCRDARDVAAGETLRAGNIKMVNWPDSASLGVGRDAMVGRFASRAACNVYGPAKGISDGTEQPELHSRRDGKLHLQFPVSIFSSEDVRAVEYRSSLHCDVTRSITFYRPT